MTDFDDILRHAGRLSELIEKKLGPKGPDLRHQIRRTDRNFSKPLLKDAHLIAQAEIMARHPKLSRQLDRKAIFAAFDRLEAHLKTIDPAKRRRDALIDWLGGTIARLAFICVILGAVMHWRGLI